MPARSSSSVRLFYPRYRRSELLATLRARVRHLADILPLKRGVLFGSWAEGRATAFSDIDLLVVYEGPPREDAYRLVRKTLNLRGLEAHVYAQEEADQMAETLKRMTRRGEVIF